MKRKIIVIMILAVLSISTFSFADDEDFPIALKISFSHSVDSNNLKLEKC